MASLFIKDAETAELATRVARRRGVTKTQAVRDALLKAEADLPTQPVKQSTADWLRDYRRLHPLPPLTGEKADKAFFDEMWGEEPD